ncbi:MAG: hypothetical protein PF448_07775 [Bacteroidales bacterium]|jgi:hypothetical protein|nr:hypothetical protein [Bacteroidales bacterium]
MKKLLLFIFFASTLSLILSCGGETSDKKSDDETKTENQEAKLSAKDGLVTAELPSEFKARGEGIDAADEHRLYVMIDNEREFYKIMEYDYAEILDPNKETKIDGLPALTNKYKYQANGDMIARTWLIWNGIDQIQITVQAPAENFDDELANKLIGLIKINEREGELVLPEPKEEARHIVPETFPEDGIMLFEEYFSKDVVLDLEKIANAMSFFDAMVNIDSTDIADEEMEQTEFLNNLAKEYGLDNYAQFEQITMSSNGAYSLMHSFNEIQTLDEESEDYKFTYDIIKSFIEQSKLSYEDIKFVFDEWDQVKRFVLQLENNKKTKE